MQEVKKLTKKQKIQLFLYQVWQRLKEKWKLLKSKLLNFLDSHHWLFIIILIICCLESYILSSQNIFISQDHFYTLSLTLASIIGAAITIIFSFSTFVLQSTSELFSTQYLNKFLNNPKEKGVFFLLVLYLIISFSLPICSPYSDLNGREDIFNTFFRVFENQNSTLFLNSILPLLVLSFILLHSFWLIYILYKDMRMRMNPETTLKIIKDDAMKQLSIIHKKIRKTSNAQTRIFQYDSEQQKKLLEVQYKNSPKRNSEVLSNVKYLYEIGLRLLSKNEITSFNVVLNHIVEIYLKHLELRNSFFIKEPIDIFGTTTVDDQNFSTTIFEYLQSISDRLILEQRKENLLYLFKIYQNIIVYTSKIKYIEMTENHLDDHNPLLNLAVAYYSNFINKIIASTDDDLIQESIQSTLKISNFLLQKTNEHLLYKNIIKILDQLLSSCLNKEAFLNEITKIYFIWIGISRNRYENDDIFWNDLFEQLEKSVLSLVLASNDLSLSSNRIFISFEERKIKIANISFKTPELREKFLEFLKRWSKFLLNFARKIGLNNKIGLPIIQSIENNLNILYHFDSHNLHVNLQEIYLLQFYILSWYFEKVDTIDNSSLINFKKVMYILLNEIDTACNNKRDCLDEIMKIYISLIKQYFEKCKDAYGYEQPRIIINLVSLGLLLQKYDRNTEVEKVIKEVILLNEAYLKNHEQYFKMKKEGKNILWPEEDQLCIKLNELWEKIFWKSTNDDIANLLKSKITKEIWHSFMEKMKLCKSID